jgi:hypothetical protein
VPLDIDWLGMAATWESLSAQLLVLIVFSVFFVKQRSAAKQLV